MAVGKGTSVDDWADACVVVDNLRSIIFQRFLDLFTKTVVTIYLISAHQPGPNLSTPLKMALSSNGEYS